MTAKAPTPGGKKKQDAATASWKITVDGRTLELPVAMPIGEKFLVRAATGHPLEVFLREEGEDSVAILWWLARRHNGERRLSYEQAMSEWETITDPDDFDIDVIRDDETSDDPGKSEPA